MKVRNAIYVLIFLTLSGAWSPVIEDKINWLTIREVQEMNKKSPKKVIIDLYTNWCGWCKVMDKNTYQNDIISDYINDNFYAVKLNAEDKEEIVFKDIKFKYPEKSFAAALVRKNSISFPTTVFMNEDLQVVNCVAGYLKVPIMEQVLVYYAEDYYKNTKWEDFVKNYVGRADG